MAKGKPRDQAPLDHMADSLRQLSLLTDIAAKGAARVIDTMAAGLSAPAEEGAIERLKQAVAKNLSDVKILAPLDDAAPKANMTDESGYDEPNGPPDLV